MRTRTRRPNLRPTRRPITWFEAQRAEGRDVGPWVRRTRRGALGSSETVEVEIQIRRGGAGALGQHNRTYYLVGWVNPATGALAVEEIHLDMCSQLVVDRLEDPIAISLIPSEH